MSYILDALKKSEAERNRNSGPTLLEFRPARPRPRLPWWAIVIAVALLANLGVLAYALLRSPPPTTATVPSAAEPAPTPAPAVAATPAPTPTPVPAPAPQAALPPAPAAVAPTADAMTEGGVLPDPALARTPLPPPGIDPDDLPAVAPRAPPPQAARPAAGSELGLPTMADLTGAGVRLPELRLALHAWDPVPASRYVLLNGTRMREGEVTPDGLKLEQVTESGVVLEWRGRRFTLRPGE